MSAVAVLAYEAYPYVYTKKGHVDGPVFRSEHGPILMKDVLAVVDEQVVAPVTNAVEQHILQLKAVTDLFPNYWAFMAQKNRAPLPYQL